MKQLRRILSLAVCVCLLAGVMSVSAFALDAEDYKNIPYKCYTYIGDSIAWGYGLDLAKDPASGDNVCSRELGAYGDLIGKVIEQKNGGTTHSAATSGARLCDYRMLLETGMGKENPYTFSDWYGENRAPERSQRLQDMASEICSWVSESDLITLQLGYNDILAAPAFTLQGSPMMEEMQKLVDDPNATELQLGESLKDFLTEFSRVMLDGLKSFRTNTCAIIKSINELTDGKATIVLVGYYNPYRTLRQYENSDFAPFIDAMSLAVSTMNDYYSELADVFDNVYYCDAPEVSVFFPDGMLYDEARSDGEYALYGAHPDEEGHAYVADKVLKLLDKVNTCPLLTHDTLLRGAFLFPDNLIKTFNKLAVLRTAQFFARLFSPIFRF